MIETPEALTLQNVDCEIESQAKCQLRNHVMMDSTA